jgi:hypothetical protein
MEWIQKTNRRRLHQENLKPIRVSSTLTGRATNIEGNEATLSLSNSARFVPFDTLSNSMPSEHRLLSSLLDFVGMRYRYELKHPADGSLGGACDD